MIKTILKEINKKIDNYNKHYNAELGEEIKNNLLSLEIEKIGDFKEFLEFINNNVIFNKEKSEKLKKDFYYIRSPLFELFSESNSEIGLNPFDNYSYCAFSNFINFLSDYNADDKTAEDFLNNIEMFEFSEQNTLIYTADLLNFLSDNNNNIYYLETAIKDYGINDKTSIFTLLQIAYNTYLEEKAYEFINLLQKFIV